MVLATEIQNAFDENEVLKKKIKSRKRVERSLESAKAPDSHVAFHGPDEEDCRALHRMCQQWQQAPESLFSRSGSLGQVTIVPMHENLLGSLMATFLEGNVDVL